MKILVIVISLILSGCMVHPEEWNKCIKICKMNGGIKYHSITFPDRMCWCKNGVKADVAEFKEAK